MATRSLRTSGNEVAVIVLALLLGGCSGAPSPQTSDLRPVELAVIDEAGLAKVLAAHRGKVVLVDYWATWCQPCMELFPHTVQLHKRLAGRGLRVISVSLDDPDQRRAAALEFLIRQGADFQNFISPYGAGTRSVEAFKLDGSLPEMKLYDRQGNLRESFGGATGTLDPQQLDRAVEELLGKRSASSGGMRNER
jgi:thiol-disulfide isomerase/thioredoxin